MTQFEILPQQSLALAYAPAQLKRPFALILGLDNNFALVVRRGQEPVLKQLRLAWWREQISKSAATRSHSNPLLSVLSEVEQAHPNLDMPRLCLTLLDGWSELVFADDEEIESAISACAERRAEAVFGGFSQWMGMTPNIRQNAIRLGTNWAKLTLGADVQGDAVGLPPALKALNLLEMTARHGSKQGAFSRIAGLLRVHIYALTKF